MCRPDHYGIEYEINPWMSVEQGANRALAIEQWEGLVALVQRLGAQVELLEPVAGLPDMVFTANAGVVFRDLFITSRFRHGQRQGESPHFEMWFADHGYRVVSIPTEASFEGAGDALFCGETLFAGYIYRSEVAAHQQMAELIGCEVLSLELTDPRFYHLDTCFCPFAPGAAMYYPPAFDEYARNVLVERVPLLVPAPETAAVRFGCNAVVVGNNIVLNTGTEGLAERLNAQGFQTHHTPLDEFLKAGGSAKCLTLRLDGEDAAVW